jgi:hypothetical protein
MQPPARSGVDAFKASDTIAITLPAGAFAIGVIGRLTPERMLVVTFNPALAELPTDPGAGGWEPSGWSTWVADTLGLRDGSWLKIEPPAGLQSASHIQFSHLPRFKAIDKNGKRLLITYDPETLIATKFEPTENTPEFEGAPSFVLQDATTFEVVLSENVSRKCELPARDAVDRLNKMREVIAMLREYVSSGVSQLVFDHTIGFKKSKSATDVLSHLQARGMDAFMLERKFWGPHEIRVRVRSSLEWPQMRSIVDGFERLAHASGGRYDGFGAQAE